MTGSAMNEPSVWCPLGVSFVSMVDHGGRGERLPAPGVRGTIRAFAVRALNGANGGRACEMSGRNEDMSTPTARWIMTWSVTISLIVMVASVLGLVDPQFYDRETKNWAAQARGQDIGNLLAAGLLVLSGLAHSRGSYRAGLVWVGALIYLVYAYVVYAMAVHFNQLFLMYVTALGLSAYAILFTVDRLRTDFTEPRSWKTRRLAACTAITIGVVFSALWLSELIPALISDEVPQSVREAGLWVNPIHVIDLAIVLPAFLVAGANTLRGRGSGRFFLGPLLVFSVLMSASIVVAMILMTAEGADATLPPLLMVSLVMVVSMLAAWRYLSGLDVPAGDRLVRAEPA